MSTTITRALLVVVLFSLFSLTLPAEAESTKQRTELNIPAQPLRDALAALGRQTGLQVIYTAAEVKDSLTAPAVVGAFTAQDALARMLSNTGLRYEYLDERTIAVRAVKQQAEVSSANSAVSQDLRLSRVGSAQNAEQDASTNSAQQNSTDSAATGQKGQQIEEIVVTAQKREERTIDVPMSVTALSGEALTKAGIGNIQDLSFVVPSMNVSETGAGRQIVTIRGIGSIRGTSSLVGMYLDEMPVTGSQDGYIAASYADLRALDLERVEVLKGPQGTLFGEGAAGGVVRFITKDPDLTRLGGEVSTKFSNTGDAGWGESAQAVLNVPVAEDVFGIRMAASYENSSGWIDQPAVAARSFTTPSGQQFTVPAGLGREDINDSEVKHVRVKALFRPIQDLAVEGLVEVHRDSGGGSNTVNMLPLGRGNFLQPFDPNAPTDYTNNYDLYNLTLSYDLGFAELLSSTSRAEFDSDQSLGLLIDTPPAIPYYQILFHDYGNRGSHTSEELRLTSAKGSFNWTVGASWKESEIVLDFGQRGQDVIAFGGTTVLTSLNRGIAVRQESESWTGFGDASYELFNRLTVGAGIRFTRDDRAARQLAPVTSLLEQDFEKTTYRVYAKYKARENVNLYATAGTGFRSGQPAAPNPRYGTTLPIQLPETIKSYELGVKTLTPEGRLSMNAALFFSKYKGMQESTTIISPVDGGPLTIGLNAGDSEVKGVELDARWTATDRLTLGLAGDWTDSEITALDPRAVALSYVVGDPINLVPEYAVSATADYRFQWADSIPGYFTLGFNRQGHAQYTDRANSLVPADRRISVSSELNFLNASIGGEWNGWGVGLFGSNLLNEDGVIVIHSAARAQTRPRTVGVAIRKGF